MARAEKNKVAEAAANVPTEQTFWKRYSPHHECLLSWVGSATGHGLVLGIMFLSGLAISWGRSSDARRPPTMDVVQLPPGDGLDEGGGGNPSPFGQPDQGKEIVQQIKASKIAPLSPPDNKFQDIKAPEFTVPDAPTLEPSVGETGEDVFKALNKSVAQVKRDPPLKEIAKSKVVGAVGTRSGVVGGDGSGGLGGKGKRTGPGVGMGGPRRNATRQEKLAWKWRFDMTGDGKEHADKLSAMGVILAVPDPNGKPLVIRDLKRRPVEPLPEDISKFKDAVHWINRKPDSVFILARELNLPFVPKFVVMYLPGDREEEMAEAEKRFAQRLTRPLQKVNATWFDFQLRNGVYEPVVIRQE